MAAILKTKMAAKMWTYQLASIKIPVERYLNYLCAKSHNFIQKCTPNYLRVLRSAHLAVPNDAVYMYFLVRISIWNGKSKLNSHMNSKSYLRECELGWSQHTSRIESQHHECENIQTSKSRTCNRVNPFTTSSNYPLVGQLAQLGEKTGEV